MIEKKKHNHSILKPVQSNIPPEKALRNIYNRLAERFVKKHALIGPVSLEQLKQYCDALISESQLKPQYQDYLAICINNQIWKDIVKSVPFEKRLLLLPKCLRDSKNCRGHFDQYGLVCQHCGECMIDTIKTQAESLGYTVLIAEGSPIVMSLIAAGKIEAVIGVSCLSVLEQAFPYMEAGAVPGIAVPLLHDGCMDTHADFDWLLDSIYDSSDFRRYKLDFELLKTKTQALFQYDDLLEAFACEGSQTCQIAAEWMAADGKRWRPLLTVAVDQLLHESQDYHFSKPLCDIAVAVECFHKASLVHDDIEDADLTRYGRETLHVTYGVGVALNTGDFLLGQGYRLIAQANLSHDVKAGMVTAAADAHARLCLGQGKELIWRKNPSPLSVNDVIDIFEKKTAPAFEVALKLGLYLSGMGTELDTIIERYSRCLGIAYQIKDDINDFEAGLREADFDKLKPSLLFALAYDKADIKQRKLIETVWSSDKKSLCITDPLHKLFAQLHVKRQALDMLEKYKYQAIETIAHIKQAPLKGLLRIVISKLFNEIEMMSCCDDVTQSDDR